MTNWNWLTITDNDGNDWWSGEFSPECLPGGSMSHIGEAMSISEDFMEPEELAALRRGETVTVGGGAFQEVTLTPGYVRGRIRRGTLRP